MSALINYFNDRDRDWRLDVFVIVALAVCLWVIPSGFREITDRSEALYLHVAHNIAHHDNWLVMYVHDQPYGEKPPLPFIIYALMMELSGGEIHAPLVRFPVHVATVAILLMTYAIGRRQFGRRVGLLAAFVLATILTYAKESTEARLDMQFALWNVAALTIWLLRKDHRQLGWGAATLFWLAMSAATYTKGPLSFFFVFSVIAFDAVRLRDWRVLVLGTHPVVGIPLIVIPGYVWLSAVAHEAGDLLLDRLIGRNVIGRITQEDVSHSEPFWYYFETMFTQIAPLWGLVYAGFLVNWFRTGRRDGERLSPIVAWWLIPFSLMCLSSGKRAMYLMPLFPAMALGVGWFLDRVVFERPANRALGGVVAVIVGLTGVALAAFAAVCLVAPEMVRSRELLVHAGHGVLLLALAGLCVVGVLTVLRGGRGWAAQFVAVIAMMAALQITTFGVVGPAGEGRESSRAFVREIAELLEDDGAKYPVGVIGRADHPRYTFHAPFPTARIDDEVEFFKLPDVPRIMIVEENDFEARVERDPQGAALWEVVMKREVARRDMVVLRRLAWVGQD
jgi:4-amino-4-deoxy-L-arabinose transferase-like glycosyltransferase